MERTQAMTRARFARNILTDEGSGMRRTLTTLAPRVLARRANQSVRQIPVQPPLQKYFCFSETKIKLYDSPSRLSGGAVRDRHGREAGCGGRGCADNERR
jgi:hypothetical protein